MKIKIKIPDDWEVCDDEDADDRMVVKTPWCGIEYHPVRRKPDNFAQYIADVEALGLADGWVAVDANGDVYWSARKPEIRGQVPFWVVRSLLRHDVRVCLNSACAAFSNEVPTFDGDWRESLLRIEGGKVTSEVKRPDGQKE